MKAPNHDFLIFISIMIGLVLLAVLHFYLADKVVTRALKKFIRPKFKDRGFENVSFRQVGFNEKDDFRTPNVSFSFSPMGTTANTIYLFINYTHQGQQKRITARIDTFCYFITRVIYSDELPN